MNWNEKVGKSSAILLNDQLGPYRRNAGSRMDARDLEEIDRWLLCDEALIEAWFVRLQALKAKRIMEQQA